ncbi:MAG: peptidoglycan DD-metalloendopeptidase family protein [Fimbriimonadaceae bacterium]|nr:peptidoglycan DD-metalloendopeptidase family protein [Fimbriimonadaceae bacterium]
MRQWALVLACFSAMVAVGQPSAKPSPTKVKGLQSKLRELTTEKKRTGAALQATRRAVRAVRVDIRDVDERLDRLENELGNTTRRLEESRREQASLADDLVAARDRLQNLRDQVRLHMKAIYMRGEGQAVSAVLGVNSVGELASRRYVYERVASHDREIFTEYRALTQRIESDKKRADGLVVRIAGLKRDQERQQGDLSDTKRQKQTYLAQLSNKAEELERALAILEEESRSIAGQIARYYASAKGSVPRAFSGRLGKPVSGRMTSGFGNRFHPILKRNRMHTGVDFGAGTGTPIMAAGDGTVIFAAYGRGYGNYIVIDHGGRISTLYGHCSRLLVGSGQEVRRGQRIGLVGSTGLSTGPHLHFEVRVNGSPVNPLSYLGG